LKSIIGKHDFTISESSASKKSFVSSFLMAVMFIVFDDQFSEVPKYSEDEFGGCPDNEAKPAYKIEMEYSVKNLLRVLNILN